MPEIGEQLGANVAGDRSPLRRWLYENRDAIAPMMSGPRPRWAALAKTAADNGVTDENGNPPTRDAVRKAWQAIERTMTKQPAPPVPAADQQPNPNPPPVQTPPQPAAAPTKRRLDIKPATFKD